MNESQLIDQNNQDKEKRPFIISIICIIGLLISLIELGTYLFLSIITGKESVENKNIIYIEVIPLVYIICWIGFLRMRKVTLIIFSLNILFSVTINFYFGFFPVDFYTIFYIFVCSIIISNWKNMN